MIFSDYYKQDYVFFISNQKLSASEQIDILYRKHGESFSKEDRWTIQEFLFLCESEQFLWDELSFKPNRFNFTTSGTFFKAHGEQGANALRTHLGYRPNTIIKDLYYDLRNLGIHIFRRRLSNSDISGLFINHPTAGKCVLVNYNEDVFRQNFTIAHEIGHSVFDSDNEINISFLNDGKDNNLIEIRANTFASNFLIPKEAIKNLNVSIWTEEIVTTLALQFKTNILPLLISLKEAKFINQTQYTAYSKIRIPSNQKEDPELALSDGKLKEAKRKLMERGLSSFYINKCFEGYTKGYISERRFAEMLLTNEFELPLILEMFSLKLDYGN
ncbi:ImmA/IrrE family metallo-endopeptidase [Flavipsychrobacter stenotrophus]|uniref:ImmA/IrrE family metallo-endopeptidase n=1 Tax=Flavipsychrobacter stenotrophus TaxID=2077091 RepID=UPI001374A8C7|nr:ImmA/IrrE family metallo-endopeptidase [Flavipsychrobacter stenotrophus]